MTTVPLLGGPPAVPRRPGFLYPQDASADGRDAGIRIGVVECEDTAADLGEADTRADARVLADGPINNERIGRARRQNADRDIARRTGGRGEAGVLRQGDGAFPLVQAADALESTAAKDTCTRDTQILIGHSDVALNLELGTIEDPGQGAVGTKSGGVRYVQDALVDRSAAMIGVGGREEERTRPLFRQAEGIVAVRDGAADGEVDTGGDN